MLHLNMNQKCRSVKTFGWYRPEWTTSELWDRALKTESELEKIRGVTYSILRQEAGIWNNGDLTEDMIILYIDWLLENLKPYRGELLVNELM